jgi:hypothetical protein
MPRLWLFVGLDLYRVREKQVRNHPELVTNQGTNIIHNYQCSCLFNFFSHYCPKNVSILFLFLLLIVYELLG